MPTISVSKPQARVQKARERLVGLLRQDQRKGDVPTCFISRDEAQYLWKCGFAAWIADSTLKVNKCKPLKLRDLSATMQIDRVMRMSQSYRDELLKAWAA